MRQWKHIGIFVSSTFKDMDVERDALRTLVEPKVNKHLEKYMLSVEFIDLRHSVKTDKGFNEAERERQICSVCFREIDRSSPYFIGLLGHRYGWIPPTGIIENDSANVFPVADQYLSVTAHEYIRGLFTNTDSRGCVFVRKASSYRNIKTEELSDFIEKGANEQYVDSIRHYLLENDEVNTIEYDIDLGNVNSSSIAEWVDLAYSTILNLLAPECKSADNDDELSEFLYLQERYVQSKTKNFKGRQKELDEFVHKLKQRNCCIISETEYGTGMHSFICEAYVQFRQDNNNVCLFYSSESASGYVDLNKLPYLWTLHLSREYIKDNVNFDAIKDNEGLINARFKEYVDMLTAQGKDIYAFIGDQIQVLPDVLHDVKLIQLCRYSDKVSSLRPIMYMLEPYRKETVLQIVEPLRYQVRSRLMMHPRSKHAKWLQLAVMQLDRLDKMDFLSIRRNSETDNEKSIVNYQLAMIDEFPYDTNEMMLRWYEKVCNFLGRSLVDRIIYTLGINDTGITASAGSTIAGCRLSEFTIACHALGEDLISERANGLWGLTNRDTLSAAIETISVHDKGMILSRMHSYAKSYQCLQQSIMRIYMMSLNIGGFTELIESCKDSDELLQTSYADDFVWMATFFPYDLKRFFVAFTSHAEVVSYKFIYNLMICVKQLSRKSVFDVYAGILNLLKNWIAKLWSERQIDSETYSLYGDVLACETDYNLHLKNYREAASTLEYGILHSKDMMQKEPLWTKSYLFFIYRKIHLLNHNYRFDVLKTAFVPLERRNQILIPEGDDTTLYAILLVESFKYYTANKNYSVCDLAAKAIDMFENILDKRINGQIETVLKPVDVIRNLLYNFYVVLSIDENASQSLIPNDWYIKKGWEIIRKCEPLKACFDTDIALYYYYAVIGKLIKIAPYTVDQKITDLYNYVFEVIGMKGCLYVTYIIMSRNEHSTTYNFAAYISLMSNILHLLSHTDMHSIAIPKHIFDKQTEGFEKIAKKKTHLEFTDELRTILPLIGVKTKNDDGLLPDSLKDSMISIYESMINVELAKSHPDGELINKLYNSCKAEIHESELGDILPYSIRVIDKRLMIEILDKYKYDESLFDDYSDGLGLAADVFSCEKGMWANGDPELAFNLQIIDIPGEYTWSRQELEERIRCADYASIIDKFSEKSRISAHEAYYLGLALMRTGEYEHAFNVMQTLIDTELSEEILSNGQVISVITNFLIACLLSHHFEEYSELYSMLKPDLQSDDDIVEIHEAYLKCVEDGSHEVTLNTPYGYTI